ncbi:MAG: hypothetical protein VX234_14080, partial [Pseudomonadota bacterium]|nr:hypothetical protein [Pseudomonadota bacterium]
FIAIFKALRRITNSLRTVAMVTAASLVSLYLATWDGVRSDTDSLPKAAFRYLSLYGSWRDPPLCLGNTSF